MSFKSLRVLCTWHAVINEKKLTYLNILGAYVEACAVQMYMPWDFAYVKRKMDKPFCFWLTS